MIILLVKTIGEVLHKSQERSQPFSLENDEVRKKKETHGWIPYKKIFNMYLENRVCEFYSL